MENEIADVLRELVKRIYETCVGAYGVGEGSYEGEFELEIQEVAKAIVKAIDNLQP